MKTNLRRRTFFLLIATVLLLSLTAPTVVGQATPGCYFIGDSHISLTGAKVGSIEPGTHEDVPIDWEYQASLLAFSITPITIRFGDLGAPAWSQTLLSSTTEFVQAPPAEETIENGSLVLTISLHEDAPPGALAEISVHAEAEEGTCVPGAQTESTIAFRVAGEAEPEETKVQEIEDPSPSPSEAAIPAGPAILTATAALAALTALRRRNN